MIVFNIVLICSFIITIVSQLTHGLPPSKIVGGNVASIYNWPSVVSLQYDNFHMCGGTLITKCHVLTAAHCVEDTDKNSIVITTGSSDQLTFKHEYNVKSYKIHPGYRGESGSYRHDIAIITLDTCIIEDETQRVSELLHDHLGSNIRGTVVGWGKKSYRAHNTARFLQQVNTWTINNDECINLNPLFNIYRHQLCTQYGVGHGFCNGDSGGPLFVNGQVAGIVSLSAGCGAGTPDIYTRISSYLSWIKSEIQLT